MQIDSSGGENVRTVSLIFSVGLVPTKYNPVLFNGVDEVWIIEHSWYFGGGEIQFYFNKKKILMYRLAMKEYMRVVSNAGYTVKYYDYSYDFTKDIGREFVIHCIDPVDVWMLKFLRGLKCWEVVIHENPMFLLENNDLVGWKTRNGMYNFNNFYKELRKKFLIMVDKNNRTNGKWMHNTYEYESIKYGVSIPKLGNFKYVGFDSAVWYVERFFGDYYGNVNGFNWIPVTRQQALSMLKKFVYDRLYNFGTYQYALNGGTFNPCNFHSGISMALNMGLILPMEVIKMVENKWRIPMESREGFIRQVLGWREFMRMIYCLEGSKMREGNYFKAERKLGNEWYTGETNIPIVDRTIVRAFENGYLQHNERLMIICNVMTLAGICPNDIYQWFMEFSIDSYDWVVVGNVYGMGTYANGGMIIPKLYISSSSYAKLMGDDIENVVWDALFWNFIWKHRKKIKNIKIMKQFIRFYKGKTEFDKKKYKIISKAFIGRTTK